MKIFLGWSGKRSQAVAEALNVWLRDVIQAIQPFFSPDIDKGVKWRNELDAALMGTQFGIICLTPENINNRWIHYEAGALSKTAALSSTAGALPETQGELIWTFLHGITPKEVPPPLEDFQHTVSTNREDVLLLMQSINRRLKEVGETPLEDEVLRRAFNKSWRRLENKLKGIPEEIPDPEVTPSPGIADKELKFSALGMDGIHEYLTDENLQERLKASQDIRVLKTWFPESMQIAQGLIGDKGAIAKKANVQLLLCKPRSVILRQRSLGADRPDWWGAFTVYEAVRMVYNQLLKTPNPAVRIALYDSWPGCPVIWYDDSILMGFYFRGKSSPAWPWISVRKGSELAEILEAQFNELWEDSNGDLDTEHLDSPEQMKSWLDENKEKEWAGRGVIPEQSTEP